MSGVVKPGSRGGAFVALAATMHTRNSAGIYTTIQPGLSENSVFVFDIAPDAADYLLVDK
jgi:hypothetical protein